MIPKFGGPVKDGKTWPGKFHIGFKHPGVQYPWKFQCPEPLCFYAIVAATEELLDHRIEQHTCPWFGGGTTTFSWGVMSDEYLKPIWDKLDAEVDIIKSKEGNWQAAQFRARGLAEALAILMPPFFTTGDEIVREAIVRWEKRQAGEDYETPGIGRRRFQRPPGAEGVDNPSWVTKPEYVVGTERPKKVAPPPTQLSLDAVAAIKKAKGFPVEILVAAYGVSAEEIKKIQEG